MATQTYFTWNSICINSVYIYIYIFALYSLIHDILCVLRYPVCPHHHYSTSARTPCVQQWYHIIPTRFCGFVAPFLLRFRLVSSHFAACCPTVLLIAPMTRLGVCMTLRPHILDGSVILQPFFVYSSRCTICAILCPLLYN